MSAKSCTLFVRPAAILASAIARCQSKKFQVGTHNRRDLETGTYLTTYKGADATRQGLTILGSDYLVATEQGKAQALVFWAWHRVRRHSVAYLSSPGGLQDGVASSVAKVAAPCHRIGDGSHGLANLNNE